MPAAFLTGAVLIAGSLLSLWIAKPLFALVAGVLVLMAQGELYAAMSRHHRAQPATLLGLALGALILLGAYLKGESAMISMLSLGLVFTSVWHLATTFRSRKDPLINMALTVFGIIYVPFLAAAAFIILRMPSSGRSLLLGILGLTFVYDTVAFLAGSVWGERPLAPNVSPKKSWEGAIAATLLVVVVAVVSLTAIADIDAARALAIALAVVICAPLGDLVESLIKRDLELKDMSSILPGHGGVLDRIDSLLLVVPAALVTLKVIL